MSDLNRLVGNTIEKALISKSGDTLFFVTEDEEIFEFALDSDCCSETWFSDIDGVANLLGRRILEASEVDVPHVTDGRCRQEHDVFYGIKIKTTAGYVDLVFRNSSNGYYGGSCTVKKHNKLPKSARFLYELTDDFRA